MVIDRLIMKEGLERRLTDSIETAVSHSGGIVLVNDLTDNSDTLYSLNYAC